MIPVLVRSALNVALDDAELKLATDGAVPVDPDEALGRTSLACLTSTCEVAAAPFWPVSCPLASVAEVDAGVAVAVSAVVLKAEPCVPSCTGHRLHT